MDRKSKVPAFTPANVAWVVWSNNVHDFVKSRTGENLYAKIPRWQVHDWFDAGLSALLAAEKAVEYMKV